MDQPKTKKVFLALPTYANAMRKDFVLSLLQLLWINPIPGVEWTIGTVGGDGVARARNNLTQNFLLSSDCEYIFFIDVDIVFERDQVARILSFLSPERPIVGGLYAAKQVKHRWIKTDVAGESPDENGLMRVKEVGTGFKGYHRSYFQKVILAFPEIQYFCDGNVTEPTVKWDFFSMGVVNGRYLTEDYYTDYRAAAIGIPVYVDTSCMVEHEGSLRYPITSNMKVSEKLELSTIFKIAESMGAYGHTVSEEVIQSAIRLHCAA